MKNITSSWLIGLGISLLTVCFPTQVKAAEKISFYYDPFGDFKVRVEDLEILAREDRIIKKLAFFTDRLTPKQLEQFQDLLARKIEFNAIALNTVHILILNISSLSTANLSSFL